MNVGNVATQYYCLIGEEKIGPIGAKHVRRLAQAGVLTRSDFVRRASDKNWQSADSIESLFESEPTRQDKHNRHLSRKQAQTSDNANSANAVAGFATSKGQPKSKSSATSPEASETRSIKVSLGCYRGSTSQTFTGTGYAWTETFSMQEIVLQQPKRGSVSTKTICNSCGREISLDVLSKRERWRRWFRSESGKFFVGSLVVTVAGLIFAAYLAWISWHNGVFETLGEAVDYYALPAGMLLALPALATIVGVASIFMDLFDGKHDSRVEVLYDLKMLRDKHKVFLNKWKGDS